MKDCKPAYPNASAACGRGYDGLTRRELFAAMVMQGFAADCDNVSIDWVTSGKMAKAAVGWADSLIAELDK